MEHSLESLTGADVGCEHAVVITTVRQRSGLAATGLCALLLTSCGGGEPDSSIEVTASFSLCHKGTCHGLPAARANVSFRDGGGRELSSDTLDDAGHIKRYLKAGTYTVEVSLPELGLAVDDDDTPIVLSEGMGFSALMYFPTDLAVAEQDQPASAATSESASTTEPGAPAGG